MTNFGPVQIPDTELRSLTSREGREYEILLFRPSAAPPPGGFPVIYLLEGRTTFGTFVEAIRMRSARPEVTRVVPTVVVGIAYPGVAHSDRARRTFDFTPGPSTWEVDPHGRAIGHPPGEIGGADALLHFLLDEVQPLVAGAVPADRRRQTLFGHSLGGYFVLRTLLQAPHAFHAYVAASPSIWWDAAGLQDGLHRLRRLERDVDSARRIMLTAGEYDQKLSPWERDIPGSETTEARRRARAMVDSTRRFAERLAEAGGGGVEVEFEEFAGEDHASSVLRTIGRCLRFVLAPPRA